jgi:hypothetical protein
MLKEYHITLREVTTKDMIIVAPTKMEAANTALRFHFGESDQEDNARIKSLTTRYSGTVHGAEANLSEGLIHCVAVD